MSSITTPWRPVGRYEDGPPQKGMVGDCAWMWYVDGGYWELVLQPHTRGTHVAYNPSFPGIDSEPESENE